MTGQASLYNGELDKWLRKGMNGNVESTCIRWWDRSYGNMMILIFVNENYRLRLIKASPALTNPSVWRHLVRLHVLKGKWWSWRRLRASQTDVQSSSRHNEDSVCLSAPRWVKLRDPMLFHSFIIHLIEIHCTEQRNNRKLFLTRKAGDKNGTKFSLNWIEPFYF